MSLFLNIRHGVSIGVRKFGDKHGEIRSRKSNKYRQCNGQKNKNKGTNNDLQNITQKSKDQATETRLAPGAPGGLVVRVPLVAPTVLLQLQTR